ncbi:hypothetical protein [Mycolicibacterium monacense]|uniref:hypothetical protein n=1 Tax=Mycolicibacterium monacense TaxID=85693 RepID=UPI001F460322|nr:hypothetical protein [Mycolicibacterium monacense]
MLAFLAERDRQCADVASPLCVRPMGQTSAHGQEQPPRAMLVAGRRHGVRGQMRTKAFRLPFLVAYGARIGERLAAASSSATAEMQGDERLLPVLVARNRAADEAFARLFPTAVGTPLVA